jgi:hypothetical protein
MLEHLEVIEGICRFRPRGESSLVKAVELINVAIAYCREQHVSKLLVNGTGLVGIPVPTLVDRFLMVEEWAEKSQGMLVMVLVVHAEYIHPQKFGMRVARDFGLMSDVYSSETPALEWLASVADPTSTA